MNIRAINAYRGTSFPEVPSLFVEAAGSESSVEDDLELVLGFAEEEGAVEVAHERDADRRAELWAARHCAAYAWAQLWPGTRECVTDVCVSLEQLPAAVTFARETADRLELRAGILGHVGDGNFHVGVTVDPNLSSDVEGWHELSRLVVEDAVARGGTCTGEHGVGIGKMRALELEHPDLLPLYRGIKQLFDPRGIMNPGKVVRLSEERRTAAGSRSSSGRSAPA
jgi:D-lactate dehydrogenase (cytochrome)